MKWIALCAGVSGALLLGAAQCAFAQQGYPSKSIRMLVGFAPGGSTDTVARLISQRLAERLGQQVVIENRGGAAGNIAAELAARAAPDGYTLFMASASHAINASLYSKLPFDPYKDYAAVTLVSSSPFILVIPSAMAANSVRDLIAIAKAKPGQLTYASGGASSFLAGEWFKSLAGINIVHVPYKSSGPAVVDLLSGQVSIMFSAPPAAMPHVSSGRLRALGVTGSKRLSSAPDIPPIAESGLTGYDVDSWSGLLVPARTNRNIIARLNREVVAIMDLQDVKSRLPALGLEARTNTPEQFSAYLKAEIEKWGKVVRLSGAKAE